MKPSFRNLKDAPFVIIEDGIAFLYSQTGDRIGRQIKLVLTDEVQSFATYELTGLCNLVSSKEEMLKMIAENADDLSFT